MTTHHVKSITELRRGLKKEQTRLRRAAARAIRRAAVRGAALLRRNVPVAFSELRDSVRVKGHKIVVDAPHAAAVNDGSRPHRPPIEPIIKWVKLRGMQGLTSDGRIKRLPGTTTIESAKSVARMLAAYETDAFGSRGHDGASPTDAPTRVAWAIANAIAKRGTKPHHFIEKTGPEVFRILDEEMARELAN